MIERIPFDSIGHANHGWLDARHHFSFANYHDPERMGVGPLIVWNDDTIQAGAGFPMHPHRDMEIITYVRTGQVDHADHLGNRGTTKAGDVQVMSAGTGIMHAEYNMGKEATTLFQIWIAPNRRGLPPRWDQREFPRGDRANRLVPLASGQDDKIEAGALFIAQDATIYGATLTGGTVVEHAMGSGRIGYLVASEGRIKVNGIEIGTRDGAVIRAAETLTIEALEDAEIVLADLPDQPVPR
ncbi:MAG: pirin family protein [Azospirillaceae bacterium]